MESVILIIDDNTDIIEFLTDSLNSKYTVLSASNGRMAIELLEKETVHLIVSDIMMPVMDGLEFCNQVKSDVHHCHIPVILLTAKKTLESKIEGLENGAD